MTVSIDFTLLDPPPHLWVSLDVSMDATQELRWLILDHNNHDRLYTRAATLDHAIGFIRAAVKHGDATCDEVSIEFNRMLRASLSEHSWRVSSSGGATLGADGNGGALSDSSSAGEPKEVDALVVAPSVAADGDVSQAVLGESASPADSTQRLRLVL